MKKCYIPYLCQLYLSNIANIHCDTHFYSRYLEKLSNVSPNCIIRFNAITQTWFNPICYLLNKDFSRSHRGSVFYFQLKCDLTHTLACKNPFYTSFPKIHVVMNLILYFTVLRTHHDVCVIKNKTTVFQDNFNQNMIKVYKNAMSNLSSIRTGRRYFDTEELYSCI